MHIKILLQALNQPWFIQPEAAQYNAAILHNIIAGQSLNTTGLDDKPVKEIAYATNALGQRTGNIQDANDDAIAVINIRGALMKYDYCGAPGTQSIMNALQQANNIPSISAIILQFDSPGGSVDGTQQLANAIKSSAKPVVAYINGMMCSAAMWLGSAASMRIASSNTDIIGSIGTMTSWNDFKGYYEKMGIKTHEVYASNSTQKNLPFREANADNVKGEPNYDPLIKTWLDPLNSEFISAIEKNLPGIDKTVLSGGHYLAIEAKKKGLIDRIGTFESAIESAIQLGKKHKDAKPAAQIKSGQAIMDQSNIVLAASRKIVNQVAGMGHAGTSMPKPENISARQKVGAMEMPFQKALLKMVE